MTKKSLITGTTKVARKKLKYLVQYGVYHCTSLTIQILYGLAGLQLCFCLPQLERVSTISWPKYFKF